MPNPNTAKPRPVFTNRLADYLTVDQAPETCPSCRISVKTNKAIRRWNKSHDTEQKKFGYCTCGHLLVFPTDTP